MQALQDDIKSRDIQIIKLQGELQPFKTLALERYTGPEDARLKALADDLARVANAAAHASRVALDVAEVQRIEKRRDALRVQPDGSQIVFIGDPGAGGMIQHSAGPFHPEVVKLRQALEAGNKEEATVVAQALTAAHPLWPYGFVYLAIATGASHDVSRALEALDDAMAADPRNPNPVANYFLLAVVHRRFSEAREIATRLKSIDLAYPPSPYLPIVLIDRAQVPSDLMTEFESIDVRKMHPH